MSHNYEPLSSIDRVFDNYYQDVGRYSILTAKEEKELIVRYKTCPNCDETIPPYVRRTHCPECGEETSKDTNNRAYTCKTCATGFDVLVVPTYCPRCGADRDYVARDKLITANLRFVIKVANTYTKDRARLLYLVSAGNVGLITALDKFDLEMETRFLTYAAWWVKKEMFDEINSSSLIRVPSHKQKEQRKATKQPMYVCRHCDYETTNPYDTPMCPREEHDFVPMEVAKQYYSVLPIDNITAPTEMYIEEDTIQDDASGLIRKSLNNLNIRQRDRFIVLQYYNLPKGERRTRSKSLHQLSEITGITPERVRQIKERTLKDLKLELKRNAVTSLDELVT